MPRHTRRPQSSVTDDATQWLRDEIDRGALKPGARLQSERDLAQRLGVSRNTARGAIRQLVREGLLVARPRVGTYVAGPSGQGLRLTPATLPTITVDRPTTAEGARLSNVISERDMAALMTARELDGITATERIRALIAIWRDVPEVGNLVDRIAKPTTRSQRPGDNNGSSSRQQLGAPEVEP